jgi:hypothetical protein
MIHSRTGPSASGFVARLTVACNTTVDSCSWLAGEAVRRTYVTAGALRRECNVAVEACRRPGAKTAFVTAVATGNIGAAKRLVGNMVRGTSIGRRMQSIVAGSTCTAYAHLRMIPLRWRPARSGMATDAVHAAHDDVRTFFASRGRSVVASGAIGCSVERTVIDLSSAPSARGFVTALAVTGDAAMNGGGWSAGLPVGAG